MSFDTSIQATSAELIHGHRPPAGLGLAWPGLGGCPGAPPAGQPAGLLLPLCPRASLSASFTYWTFLLQASLAWC